MALKVVEAVAHLRDMDVDAVAVLPRAVDVDAAQKVTDSIYVLHRFVEVLLQ